MIAMLERQEDSDSAPLIAFMSQIRYVTMPGVSQYHGEKTLE
jgi:hypothetical protein